MNTEGFCVIVFESTHFAIAAENRFKEKSFSIEIIPTPREITASCGLSIKFSPEIYEMVMDELQAGGIKIKGIFQVFKDEKGRGFQQIS